ncbi:MAG: hypothetical protein ACM3SQ_17120 [Betaproteobacteria bacterium]
MLNQTADQLIPDLARHQRTLLVAGAAGALVSLIGLYAEPAQFFQSYLLAYMLVLGLALGCLAVGMIHQLSGGAWGVVIRRTIGAASRTMPVVTLLFIPILFGMHRLYSWTHADLVAADEALRHKAMYLNVPFFLVRAAIYFIVWNALTYFLNRWSLEQDRTADPRIARRMQLTSAGGLVLYGITITFASFDWVMSITPDWFSTIYGMIFMAGQGLIAFSFSIIVLWWLSRRPPLDGIVGASHFHDLSNLTLAFVMLWAYLSFSQYLIIWAGNLPEEISWYVDRVRTGWQFLGLTLIMFHFALPFVLLLSRAIKRHARVLVRVAALIIIGRWVDLLWLIRPDFHPAGLSLSWLDVLLPASLFLLWTGCFVWQLRGRAILPVHDPQFDDALGKIIERGGNRPSTAH